MILSQSLGYLWWSVTTKNFSLPNLLNSLSTKDLFQQKVGNKLVCLIRHLKKKLNLDWGLWVDVATALI